MNRLAGYSPKYAGATRTGTSKFANRLRAPCFRFLAVVRWNLTRGAGGDDERPPTVLDALSPTAVHRRGNSFFFCHHRHFFWCCAVFATKAATPRPSNHDAQQQTGGVLRWNLPANEKESVILSDSFIIILLR